ncbi:MAG TPA: response regulator [Cytophagales bacterium]|nr:response regulator [Cytophagales bacterium]
MKFKRILLVDDDQITNFLNENLIKEMNISDYISIANDGQEALDYVKLNCLGSGNVNGACCDLILLDLNMPVMDGFEFLEKVSELKIDTSISIVLLTTSSNERDLERAKTFNIMGYINKPLTEAKIQQAIQQRNKN